MKPVDINDLKARLGLTKCVLCGQTAGDSHGAVCPGRPDNPDPPKPAPDPRAVRAASLALRVLGAYDRAPAAARQLAQALADYRRRPHDRGYRSIGLVMAAEAALRYLVEGVSVTPAATAALAELDAERDAL